MSFKDNNESFERLLHLIEEKMHKIKVERNEFKLMFLKFSHHLDEEYKHFLLSISQLSSEIKSENKSKFDEKIDFLMRCFLKEID